MIPESCSHFQNLHASPANNGFSVSLAAGIGIPTTALSKRCTIMGVEYTSPIHRKTSVFSFDSGSLTVSTSGYLSRFSFLQLGAKWKPAYIFLSRWYNRESFFPWSWATVTCTHGTGPTPTPPQQTEADRTWNLLSACNKNWLPIERYSTYSVTESIVQSQCYGIAAHHAPSVHSRQRRCSHILVGPALHRRDFLQPRGSVNVCPKVSWWHLCERHKILFRTPSRVLQVRLIIKDFLVF